MARRVRTRTLVFDAEELVTLVVLASRLNPDHFVSKRIQALIVKCQAEVANPSSHMKVVR